jgi:hypothetical protein
VLKPAPLRSRRVDARPFLIFAFVAAAALAVPPPRQTFTGVVTDSMCADGNHSAMRMGPTDAECTNACVSVHGADYVLFDGKESYTLNGQKPLEKFASLMEKFAGLKVTVAGALDAKTKTILVDSVSAAK